MSGAYFNNPIKILHRLKEAGLSDKVAEAHVEILGDYLEHGLATKKDLSSKLREQEMRFELKLKELELRMTVKTAAIVGSIVGFFSVLEKLIG